MLSNPWIRRSSWSPWTEMQRLHAEMNRLFDESQRETRSAVPPINVWSNDKGARLIAQLPGYRPDDVEITVVGDTLTLKGTRRDEQSSGGELTTHRAERIASEFTRSFQLPFRVEEGDVAARFKNGLLEIELPRARAERPRRITVTSGS